MSCQWYWHCFTKQEWRFQWWCRCDWGLRAGICKWQSSRTRGRVARTLTGRKTSAVGASGIAKPSGRSARESPRGTDWDKEVENRAGNCKIPVQLQVMTILDYSKTCCNGITRYYVSEGFDFSQVLTQTILHNVFHIHYDPYHIIYICTLYSYWAVHSFRSFISFFCCNFF